MRKHVEHLPSEPPVEHEETWIDLDKTARVQITSEADGFPIESALLPNDQGRGWQAAESGPQTLRLHFDVAQKLTRIRIAFDSGGEARTQEFAIRWSTDGGASYHDVVRQQFNFSAPAATTEEENYRVDLAGVTDLEVSIVPDISGGSAHASLKELRLS